MLGVDGISDFDARIRAAITMRCSSTPSTYWALDGYFAVGNLPLDLHRYRSLEEAIESELDPNALLN